MPFSGEGTLGVYACTESDGADTDFSYFNRKGIHADPRFFESFTDTGFLNGVPQQYEINDEAAGSNAAFGPIQETLAMVDIVPGNDEKRPSLDQFEDSTRAVLVGDGQFAFVLRGDQLPGTQYATRHSAETGNFVHADGHVESIGSDLIWDETIDPFQGPNVAYDTPAVTNAHAFRYTWRGYP